MEPEDEAQEADLDVDMINVPPSDATCTDLPSSLHQDVSSATDPPETSVSLQNTQPATADIGEAAAIDVTPGTSTDLSFLYSYVILDY